MGSLYLFNCGSCNYSVRSAGKEDTGYLSVVKPYICNNCKEVYDILIGEMGQVIPKETLSEAHGSLNELKDFYCCPKCRGKDLTDWSSNDFKCPKCDAGMAKDSPHRPHIARASGAVLDNQGALSPLLAWTECAGC